MAEKKPRKRVTALRVDEISFVDRPAVPKARFLIIKRDQTKGGDGMKLEEGQIDAEVKTAADLAKEGAEKVSKQQFETMKEARGMVSKLMLKRNDLPGFFRRMVMELDIALDEFMREREAILGKADNTDEGTETTEKRGEEDEKPEEKREETEEKAGHKEDEKPEETEEKAGHKDDKKQEEKKCPPFMEFDEEKGKCVPKKKEKDDKAEKVEEKEEEKSAPRDGGGGDALKSAETIELSAAQKKRVDKLIEKYNKK